MPGDLSDIDCTLCGVDAWGDNFENLFDNEGYCAAWTACAEAKCPAECLDEWNAYTACQLDFDCLGASGGALSAAPAAETTAATLPAANDVALACGEDECLDRCVTQYGGTYLDFSRAYYCGKGCVGMLGGAIDNPAFYCEQNQGAERYEFCVESCEVASPQALLKDDCRFGCEFWDTSVAATAPMDLEVLTLVDGALVTVQSPYDADRGWWVSNPQRYAEHSFNAATVFKLVVPGLTGEEGTVTFEERDLPGYYLRHQGFIMRSNVDDGSELFKNDATFAVEAGLDGVTDGVSFRAVNYPSMLIAHNEIYRLVIKTEEASVDYRRQATFLLQDAGAGLVTTTTPAACTDTPDYEDMYGDGCDYYESDPNYPLFCESFGTNGEAGSTPNENCCACIAAIGATVPASTTPQATTTTTQQTTTTAATTTSASEPDPPGVVEGYDYVGYGGCLDANGADYPSVQQIYTFSAGECGQFCDKFGPEIVDPADGVLRGFTWGGILGDINLHCTCLFDAGSDVEKLATELGGAREHWGSMVPAKPSVGGDGTGPPTLLSKSQYDNFCYKVRENQQATTTTPSSGCSSSSASPCPCFADSDELQVAVNRYTAGGDACVRGDSECEVVQTYGWPIGSWCTSDVTDMSYLFYGKTDFNDDLSSWDTSSVTTMEGMFNLASSFNGDVSNFDTSQVTTMEWMFYGASAFNGDVSNFDTSQATSMEGMFGGASAFNGDVSGFDTSQVTTMEGMFYQASSFNRDVSSFDTSKVTAMRSMFWEASSFNGDVSRFDTSQVTSMAGMFYQATSFNQNLCAWGVHYDATVRDFDPDDDDDWSSAGPYNEMFLNTNCPNQGDPAGPDTNWCAATCDSQSGSDATTTAATTPIATTTKAALSTVQAASETTVSGLSTVPPVDAGAPDPTGSGADECAAEAAAVEACTPTDLSALEAYLECALCGVEAMGEDVLSLNEADYCAKWTPCTLERCPVECQDPLNDLQACELGWDCLGTASGTDGSTETPDKVDSSARAVVVNARATGLLAIAAVFVLF